MLLPACSTQMKNDWSLSFMSVSPSVADLDPAARAPRRVRHEPRRRQLNVKRVDKIAAAYDPRHARRRPRGLHRVSGFDDHVKLFFPTAHGRARTANLR